MRLFPRTSRKAERLGPLWALLDPGSQQLHHFGDTFGALLGSTLRRIDPAQVATAVELCERVEERSRVRAGRQRRSDVLSEVLALRPFRCDLHRDVVADRHPVSTRRAEAKG